MAGFFVQRRLRSTSARLRKLRDELSVTEEQLRYFADEADDTSIRALVSDDPSAAGERIDARRHLDSMTRHRDRLRSDIAALEATLDDLLDRMELS